MRHETREVTITEEDQGLRLDAYLAGRYDDYSRNEWQGRIEGGFITINGIKARASRRLNNGDRIVFSYTLRDEPEAPSVIPILFEDENYLVVNKPAGLPVHPSGIYQKNTLITLLAEQGILKDGHLLHRLDRETSGVLMLAKNREATAKFQTSLRTGQIKKDYHTLVEGNLTAPLDAVGYIYRLPDSRLARRRIFSVKPPPAAALEPQTSHTVFTPLQQLGALCLIEARLHTGRMHQIRATLASLGYPLVGDKLYGVDENLYFKFVDDTMTDADWQRLRLPRSALHALRLTLTHPITGREWVITAPLPDDMTELVRLHQP